MYERLLDKSLKPSEKDFFEFCGEQKHLLVELNDFMQSVNDIKAEIRFPYGNKYGWGIKYSRKSTHICDVFAEKNSFTVMVRISNIQIEHILENLSDHTRKLLENKYPCGEGGWLHYRILNKESLNDIKTIISAKLNKR